MTSFGLMGIFYQAFALTGCFFSDVSTIGSLPYPLEGSPAFLGGGKTIIIPNGRQLDRHAG